MDAQRLASNKHRNRAESAVLILGIGLLLAAIGYAFAGPLGAGVALLVALGMVLFGPRASPAVVLKLYKAQPIGPRDSAELHAIHSDLATRAELDHTPGLYYVPTKLPNAFAVGTGKHAAVAVTDGLLRLLNPRELAGVLAHELAHVRHRDTRVMGLADTLSRVVGSASNLGKFALLFVGPAVLMGQGAASALIGVLLIVFAPAASGLLQLALSRSREFNADLGAVELTGDPQGLASALQKLERLNQRGRGGVLKTVLGGNRPPGPALLRTHPPTDERVRRIMAFAPTDHPPALPDAQRVYPGRDPRAHRSPRYHLTSALRY